MILLFLIMSMLAHISTDLLQERYLTGKLAARDLITFARLTSPLPSAPLDVRASRYQAAPHHRFTADKLMAFGRRSFDRKNMMLSMPYRHGKTEIAVRKFVPWLGGNSPYEGGIVITHTDRLSSELGRDCREVFRSSGYRLAFPRKECQLRDDSQAMDRLQLEGGAVWHFMGRDTMGGGYGAGWIIIDDFFKSAQEARSAAVRDSAWHCYVSDCTSRLNDQEGGVLLIGTRRHEDDPQGRITNPDNLHFDPVERAKWEVIKIPALAEAQDPIGRAEGDPLWPERFSEKFWLEKKNNKSELVREDFNVQGQCNPTPAEGKVFKKDWLRWYDPEELPKQLKYFATSDHAVRKGEENDRHCLLDVGVDAALDFWVLPTTWWERADTLEMTEQMLLMMKERHYVIWFAAKDAISGSLGPFLRKMMKERGLYQYIKEMPERKSLLESRVVSVRNHFASGRVHLPKNWKYRAQAEAELLAFPDGAHDDLVATLAILGMGMDDLTPAERALLPQTGMPKPGTLAWVKGQAERSAAQAKGEKAKKGW